MIRLSLFLTLMFLSPALAAPVTVASGEHDGFTRLVFDYGKSVDWTVGRTIDGYELRLDGTPPTYDFRQAFDLIGKSRLAAIWADPRTGAVHVGLACACHAMPFEFRPGIIVIDLKDGPPPKGSSFELATDGQPTKPIAGRATLRPRTRPAAQAKSPAEFDYDWTLEARAPTPPSTRPTVPPKPPAPATVSLPDPGLQPLRDTLMHQMARGAAQGMIEIVKPAKNGGALPLTGFPTAQIRIGDQNQSIIAPDISVKSDLTAQGATCIDNEILTVSAWGDATTPVSQQIAAAQANLTGEFDRPEPDAVARAIRFYLFLGFGAEARQFIAGFSPESPEAEVWRSLSYLLDEDADPSGLFATQTACDGSAALWGVLASPDLIAGDVVNAPAVRLAFSALPLHLRRQFGPKLAERFITIGDAETARDLTSAILRAPGNHGDGVALLESHLEMEDGAQQKAEDRINQVLEEPGPNHAEALIALIDARVAQYLPVEAKTALELEAILVEHKGSEEERRIGRAVVLARAASGNFEGAFAGLDAHPDLSQDVWALAARLSPDADLLRFAVLPSEAEMPRIDGESARQIATRLLDLGLAGPAGRWLEGLSDVDPVLLARLALGQFDGRTALAALEGQSGKDADSLRSLAFEMLGQEKPKAALHEKTGQIELASVAWARSGDWAALSQNGTGLWQDLAGQLNETPVLAPEAGDLAAVVNKPLAQAQGLAQAGLDTRATVEALLQTLPLPEPISVSADE